MRLSIGALKLTAMTGAIGILALTAGCGGGNKDQPVLFGTPAGLTTLPSGTTSLLSNTLNMQSGDEWFYAVNGLKQSGGTTININQARYDRTFTDNVGALAKPKLFAPKAAAAGSAITEKTDFAFQGGDRLSTSNTIYGFMGGAAFDQTADTMQADGNIEYAGNTPCDSQPIPLIPLDWSLSTTINGIAAFNVPDGTDDPEALPCEFGSTISNQEQFNLSVTAQETISVPAGTFQTFKVTSTQHYVTQGLTLNTIAWWAPQIGSFVKAQTSWTETSTGESGQYVYQLIAFKALPAPGG